MNDTNVALPVPQQEPDYDGLLVEALDSDPELRDGLDETLTESSVGLTDVILGKDKVKPQAGFWSRLGTSINRGASKAAEETARTIVSVSAGISKATGLYKLGRTPEEEAEFLKWYEKPAREVDFHADVAGFKLPLLGSAAHEEEERTKWLGPAQGGVMGFIEGVSQFAVGMVGAGQAMKGLQAIPKAGTAIKALNDMKVVKGAVQGLIVDTTMFDPYQKRLANLVEEGPKWLSNPITRFLQAKDDDSEPLARVKAGLEGIVTGATADYLIAGLKMLRAKYLVKAGEVSAKDADKLIIDAAAELDQLGSKPPTDRFSVAETPDGKFTIHDATPGTSQAVESMVKRDGKGGYVGELKHVGEDGKATVSSFPLKTEADFERFGKARGKSNIQWEEGVFNELGQAKGTSQAMNKLFGQIEEAHPATGDATVAQRAPKGPNPEASTSGDVSSTAAPSYVSRAEAEQFAATANFAYRNATRDPVMTPKDIEAWQQAVKAYEASNDPRTAIEQLEAYGFNFRYDQQPQDVVNTIKALVDQMPVSIMTRNKPHTWAEAAKQAEGLFGLSGDDALHALRQHFSATENIEAFALAGKVWAGVQARNVNKLAKMVEANPGNVGAVAELGKALDTLLEVQSLTTGAKSNVARGLNIEKKSVGEAVQALTEGQPKSGQKGAARQPTGHRAPGNGFFSGMTKEEMKKYIRAIDLADGDPQVVMKIVSGPKTGAKAAANLPFFKKWLSYINSYHIEALLSGPPTHVANFVNNSMSTFMKPVQMWWSGAPSLFREGDAQVRREAVDALMGLWFAKRDSWAAAKKAFSNGQGILDPGHMTQDASFVAMKAWDDSNWMQRLARAPSRFLMTSDEFFKQLNYRARMRSMILKRARDEGVTDAAEIAKRLSEDMQVAFDPQGGAVNPRAMDYAQDATFTKDLPDDSITKSLESFIQKHPSMRLIVPFVRTPANIFNEAWQHTPLLNTLNKQFREDLLAGGQRARIAQAKAEMGLAAYTTAATLVAAGNVTGSGPADPELRRQWREAGNQPYSIKIAGRWVSYRRGDPITTPLGFVADLFDMSREMDGGQHGRYVSAVIAAISSNITSRTYMQGLSDFMEAISSDRADVAEKFLVNVGASFVPNVLKRLNPDDTVRQTRPGEGAFAEVQTLLDEMKARLPGFSATLEPRRNLFGEKVMRPPGYLNNALNPFTLSAPMKNEDVAQQLVNLGKAFSMPDTKWVDGLIDLTDRDTFGPDRNGQSPYDRMLEIMSQPLVGGMTLRERMEQLISSPKWAELTSDDALRPGGQKHRMANEVIQAYQTAAANMVLKEYPTLLQAYKQAHQIKGIGEARGSKGVSDLMQKHEQMFVNPPRQ